MQAQGLEVEPEISVMTGLEPEMSVACAEKGKKIFFHGSPLSRPLRRCSDSLRLTATRDKRNQSVRTPRLLELAPGYIEKVWEYKPEFKVRTV